MGLGVQVSIIFTQAEYNKLLRCTVESGRKLPRTFAHAAIMEKVDAVLHVPAPSKRKRKVAGPPVDLSHLTSDAQGPVATPSTGG